MNTQEHTRLKEDLETLRIATGLGPRLGPEDVRAWAGMGLSGLLLPICHFLLPQATAQSWGMGLFFALYFGVIGYYGFQTKRRWRTSLDPARRREGRLTWGFTAVVCLSVWTFLAWAWRHGVAPAITVGTGFFMIGIFCAALAATDRWRRCWFGFALPISALGLLLPSLSVARWGAAFGLAFCVGCLSAAGILRSQLRALETEPAATHATH